MKYKTIPGYGIYRISEYGVIECYLEDKSQFEIETLNSKTSKGYYKVVNILNNKLNKEWRAIHQLVCITFNGLPPNDGNIYDVNHIDGNKLNNHYSNLEWVLHKDNTLHALKTGLRYDNVPIILVNTETKEEITYYSIIELSRVLNVSRESVYPLIGRHRVNPYKNKYIFKVNLNDFGNVNRINAKGLFIYDYIDNKWYDAFSYGMTSVITGIKSNYLRYILKKYDYVNIAGYFICKFRDQFEYKKSSIDKEKELEYRNKHYLESAINSIENLNNIITSIYNK